MSLFNSGNFNRASAAAQSTVNLSQRLKAGVRTCFFFLKGQPRSRRQWSNKLSPYGVAKGRARTGLDGGWGKTQIMNWGEVP